MSRRAAGFTVIEMLVTTVLVGLGVASVFGGIGALHAAEARAREAELLQRLAANRWDEIVATRQSAGTADRGDFADDGYPDIAWTRTIENSGIEGVEQVSVTATRQERSQTLTGLVYLPPTTSGGTAP